MTVRLRHSGAADVLRSFITTTSQLPWSPLCFSPQLTSYPLNLQLLVRLSEHLVSLVTLQLSACGEFFNSYSALPRCCWRLTLSHVSKDAIVKHHRGIISIPTHAVFLKVTESAGSKYHHNYNTVSINSVFLRPWPFKSEKITSLIDGLEQGCPEWGPRATVGRP